MKCAIIFQGLLFFFLRRTTHQMNKIAKSNSEDWPMTRYDLKHCVHVARHIMRVLRIAPQKQRSIFISTIREEKTDDVISLAICSIREEKNHCTTRNKMVINIICRNTLWFHLFVWISVCAQAVLWLLHQTKRFCTVLGWILMSQTMRRMKNWSALDALLLFRFAGPIEAEKQFFRILLEHLTLLALFAEILSSNAKHRERTLSLYSGMYTVYIPWECGRIIPYEFM